MNQPNILELIKDAQVEWKKLGEVGELVRGNGLPKSDFTEAGVPAIHYGQIYTYYGDETGTTLSFVSEETAQKLKKVNTGDVVITNTSENLEDVGKALLYTGLEQAVTGGHATIFKPSQEILGKYFVYITKSKLFFDQKRRLAKGTKVIDVSATDMHKIEIPIPSLSIQQEIVRILDTFTAVTSELTSELTAREKQYNYYRDQLLSFTTPPFGHPSKGGEFSRSKQPTREGELESRHFAHAGNEQNSPSLKGWQAQPDGVVHVEWKRLGDIVRIRNGKDHKALGDGEFPVYGSGGVMRYVDTYAYDKPTVLIPRKGSLGNLFYVDIPFWNVDTIFYTEIDTAKILPKFFYYFLTTLGLGNMNQAGGVPSQTQAVLNELKIPVPSLSEQARIVAILDKFDTLTNSISEGLPREIELRQKQYEYYRDLLLNFPKSNKEVAA